MSTSYDLLLKAGHVLDPGQGIDQVLDIGVKAGKIVVMKASIPESDALRTIYVGGTHRYVTPGLLDIHTHCAHGAFTSGVGLACCDPDDIGVLSGVTTVVDGGSVGVSQVGSRWREGINEARTRVLTFVNVGSHAHSMPGRGDVESMGDIRADAIARCVAANAGIIDGVKLRLMGAFMEERGEEVVRLSRAIARELGVPLMVHIGDITATARPPTERLAKLTRYVVSQLDEADILTHLCTPQRGGVLDGSGTPFSELEEARKRGVVLDAALGAGNFGYEVAAKQAEAGIFPDTISSDLSARTSTFHSLVECMAKFMALGYGIRDVVRMTTASAARAVGLASTAGALAVGRVADITVLDVVGGEFQFTDTVGATFEGRWGIVPVQTIRDGEPVVPRWGTHPWGWLPARRAM